MHQSVVGALSCAVAEVRVCTLVTGVAAGGGVGQVVDEARPGPVAAVLLRARRRLIAARGRGRHEAVVGALRDMAELGGT